MLKYVAPLVALFLLMANPASAAGNWSGFYVGANAGVGYGSGAFTDDCYFCATDSFSKGFFMAGGQGGFNWQSGAAVFGVEGDFDWSSLSRKGVLGADDSDFLREKLELSWLASIRARAGLSVDNALVYLTAGPAFGHIDAPGTEYCCNGVGGVSPATGQTFSKSGSRTGMIGGIGLEVMLQDHWSVRGEYLYFDLGSETVSQTPPTGSCATTRRCTVQNTLDGQVARVAMNFHF